MVYAFTKEVLFSYASQTGREVIIKDDSSYNYYGIKNGHNTIYWFYCDRELDTDGDSMLFAHYIYSQNTGKSIRCTHRFSNFQYKILVKVFGE